MQQPLIQNYFDAATNTISYIVTDPITKTCAVIDSVADYEPHSGTLSYTQADRLISYIQEQHYTLLWILETHIHADHLSAASYIKNKIGGTIAIGKPITEVQKIFKKAFHDDEFIADGSQFDVLLDDGQILPLGTMTIEVLHVPGHTPADAAYKIGNSLFVGDTIFMPDYGSARCDFPGSSAEMLYNSVQKLFTFPDETKMFLCHDYLPEGGRTSFAWETTVGEQKKFNIHLRESITKNTFVEMREAKDKKLGMPKLIIPSLQVNIRAGEIPTIDSTPILRIPVNGIFTTKTTL